MSSRLEAILERFCASAHVDAEAIEALCDGLAGSGDLHESLSDLRQLAHRLAGTAGSLGFAAVGATARSIDGAVKELLSQDAPDAASIARLRGPVAELKPLVAALRPHRSSLWNGALHDAQSPSVKAVP